MRIGDPGILRSGPIKILASTRLDVILEVARGDHHGRFVFVDAAPDAAVELDAWGGGEMVGCSSAHPSRNDKLQ